MSTRCQVIVKDKYDDEVWFYRHSDGYPDGVKPSLSEFLTMVKNRIIRDNSQQASGWLVLIGHQEYGSRQPGEHNWKIGAYEPCSPKKHGDIEFLYIVDLVDLTVKYYVVGEPKEVSHPLIEA